jgi:hypothetical protein
MQQNTPSFTWGSYGSMWLSLQGVLKRALQLLLCGERYENVHT